jgi:hypothetical protein
MGCVNDTHAWKGLKETREKKSIFFNFTNLLNHREVIAYSVLSFGEDHKVRVAPLRFILYFGRGPPLQAEVQGSELYEGAKCFVELGTCPSFNQWFSSLDEKEMNLDW